MAEDCPELYMPKPQPKIPYTSGFSGLGTLAAYQPTNEVELLSYG